MIFLYNKILPRHFGQDTVFMKINDHKLHVYRSRFRSSEATKPNALHRDISSAHWLMHLESFTAYHVNPGKHTHNI